MEKEFEKYVSETRDEFVLWVKSLVLNPEQRVKAENILIAYDQMRERLKSKS